MTTRIVVAGAGLIGLAVGDELLRRGCAVTIVDAQISGAASAAAAGILGAQFESHEDDQDFRARLRARENYPQWTSRLERESGRSVGYLRSGLLKLARSTHEESELRERVRWQRSVVPSTIYLNAKEVGALEPSLAAVDFGGAYFPDDAQVNPPALLDALRQTTRSAHSVHGRVCEVVPLAAGGFRIDLVDGPSLEADAVVVAMGAYTPLVKMFAAVAVTPVRGQMARVSEPRLRTILASGDAYALPRGNGHLDCGATMEHVGYGEGTTVAGIQSFLEPLAIHIPPLRGQLPLSTWSGIRPIAPSPLLMEPQPGLLVATGHGRNGVLLAHETALDVAHRLSF